MVIDPEGRPQGELCDSTKVGVVCIGDKAYVILALMQGGQQVGMVVIGAATARAIGQDLIQVSARPGVSPQNVSIDELIEAAGVPAGSITPPVPGAKKPLPN